MGEGDNLSAGKGDLYNKVKNAILVSGKVTQRRELSKWTIRH